MRRLVALTILVAACGMTAHGQDEPSPPPSSAADAYELEGLASWYGARFQGRLTANGETFDTNQLTAAHRTLPFDSIVRVTNLVNDLSVVVRINDRGPFVEGRVIDLSRAAADIVGITGPGIAPVTIEILHLQLDTDLRTIQVASFSRLANADAVATRLRERGIGAAIETVETIGVHRVIIQGVTESDIPELRERLADLGHRSVLVRRK